MMRWSWLGSSPVVSVSRTIWRTRAILTAVEASVDGRVRQPVGALVALIARVSLHPVPVDAMSRDQRVELLPQVDVLDGLLVGRAPVAPFPVDDPGRDAVLDVLRIGVEL